MRSATTQRMFGSGIVFARSAATPRAALQAGKLAGILLGAGALGLAFALFPLRTPDSTRFDVLAITLALVVQGLAYALPASGGGAHRATPLITLGALPLVLLLHLMPLVAGAIALVIVLAGALEGALVSGRARAVMPLAALSLPALVALAVSAPPAGVLAGALVLLVPGLYAAFAPQKATLPAVNAPSQPDNALPALVRAALGAEGRALLVCDSMGVIDGARTPDAAVAALFPEGSLTEATLIADRVALLSALSQATRGAQAGAPLTLRLRQGAREAGVPPRFDAQLLRIFPLPGVSGRAGVLIEPREPKVAAPQAAQVTGPSPALLARALHDAVAPFNAGMGFLEMVADPRLAPRDFTALHDFAAEAHKAMAEAHRNSVLQGLWMRLMLDEAHARARADMGPRRLLTETLRLMGLEEMEKRADLVAGPGFEAPVSYAVPVNALRFALAVLLRFGAGAGHMDLAFAEEGEDLVIDVTRRAGSDHPGAADALQQMLEQAVSVTGDMMFETMTPACRRLRVPGAALTRRAADALRLAS